MKHKTKLVYATIGIALIVFAFTDLAISEKVFNESSQLSLFLEKFGEFPMSLIGCFSAASLIVSADKKKSLATVGIGFLLAMNAATAALLPGLYLGFPKAVIVLFALVYFVGFLLIAKQISPDKYMQLRKIAKIGLVLSIAPILIVTIGKIFWGRQRYRSMVNPALDFTPWYLPQGFTTNNEFMSFPSGHSANSSVILWIGLLPLVWEKLKKIPLNLIAWIWLLGVMVSRVIVGAHFASDITMGFAITFTLFVLLKQRYLKGADL